MEMIFVALDQFRYGNTQEAPLGWGIVYSPGNEKFESRFGNMLNWGCHVYSGAEYKLENGVAYSRKYGKTLDSDWFLLPVQPKIVENTPIDGFKIYTTVSRRSTSNKLWRILDPRGFQLEISTANMEEIIQDGIIDKGKLIGKYQWDFGKNGIGKVKLKKVDS